MDKRTRESLCGLIGIREEIAFRKLNDNLAYQRICKRQNESEEAIEAFYGRFEQAERNAIHRHYEGETERTSYEIKEAYIQGLCDCFSLLSFLSGNEVQI